MHDVRPFVIGDAHAPDVYGIDVGGTGMIRPDGYVAARWAHDPGSSTAAEFHAAERRARGWE